MRRQTPNSLVFVAALAVTPPAIASAKKPGVEAALSCRQEAAPGRVLCELRVTPVGQGRLVWSDALVTEAPPFARPLRARVSPQRFSQAGAAEGYLTLAFVATEAGTGRVVLLARAVVCRGDGARERCQAEIAEAAAEIRVGS